MESSGVDILALNCGSGVDGAWSATVVRRYRQVADLPTMAQPNAGQPVLENLEVVYKEEPETMANQLQRILAAGASVVGGCCGTTPGHIRRFRRAVEAWNAKQV